MKKISVLLLAAALLVLPLLAIAEFDASGLIDWFNEDLNWMTVANGHWSADAADQITDEQLAAAFSMATKQQNAVHWTPWYFVVVKDVEEQKNIIGDYWAAPEEEVSEGTVTILCLADQILTDEQGHVTPYEGTYMPTSFAYYDSGLTCGVLGVALASQGYATHYFGTVTGANAPKDMADGAYQSMSRYLSADDMRVWGFRSPYNGEVNAEFTYPVLGNCVFVTAIVVGKPAAGETVETWGTNHNRPANWKIWDGTVNEAPVPVGAGVVDAASAATAEEADTVSAATTENAEETAK